MTTLQKQLCSTLRTVIKDIKENSITDLTEIRLKYCLNNINKLC